MHLSSLLLPLAVTGAIAVPYRQQPSRNGNRVRQMYVRAPSKQDVIVPNSERADAVKEAFTHAWNGYYTYAFPNDELHPVTDTFGNSRCVRSNLKTRNYGLPRAEMPGALAPLTP